MRERGRRLVSRGVPEMSTEQRGAANSDVFFSTLEISNLVGS